MKYTAEEVREAAATNEHPIPLRVRDMLTAYADSMERAQGGVTDEVVFQAMAVFYGYGCEYFNKDDDEFAEMRAALLAVWPTTTNPSETGSKLVDAELYKSACDSAEEWKARALKAGRIAEQLGDALNDMTGPTFMGEPVLSKPVAQHPDDAAVDAFAMAMKAKLAEARAKGRGGWQDKADCPQQRLSDMLRAHVAKGDPRDVANFCMFLHQRGESILPAEPVAQGDASQERCKACGRATRAVCDGLDGNGLGCTNAPSIDLAAVREVIESHINEAKKLRHDPESQDYLYEQADKLEAAIKGGA